MGTGHGGKQDWGGGIGSRETDLGRGGCTSVKAGGMEDPGGKEGTAGGLVGGWATPPPGCLPADVRAAVSGGGAQADPNERCTGPASGEASSAGGGPGEAAGGEPHASPCCCGPAPAFRDASLPFIFPHLILPPSPFLSASHSMPCFDGLSLAKKAKPTAEGYKGTEGTVS